MQIADIEKLGAFYLGRVIDDAGAPAGPFLLDSRALTTHAVCIGMTGSGKTGLCTALLEEAAIDGVGAIIVDPKGDLGGLALAFDVDNAAAYAPFVDAFEARRNGQSVDERAQGIASGWRQGLIESLQTPERVARYRDAVDVRVYTPGASHGRALSLVKSFAAPPRALLDDVDGWRQRLQAQASSLLALLGESADPVQSREHVFLSAILDDAGQAGVDLTLAEIVKRVQKPPFATVGVLDVDTFYPSADRLKLALRLNNLLASPGFAAWMSGDALDVSSLLTAPDGRPRLSVLNLAHLSDAERMFVVTLLAGEVVAWMRQQPGTQSLRGLLFIDEVTGFLPPVANPPSKQPLMTLFKQARAFGLGVVLASQNPVDVDYKALSNAGTWLIGRLQTARDRERVVDGLAGVVDGAALDARVAALPKRAFFVHSVHIPAPVVVSTRCTLTFLPGPLTPVQIRALTSASTSTPTAMSPPAPPTSSASQPALSSTSPPTAYKPLQLVTATLGYDERKNKSGAPVSGVRRFVVDAGRVVDVADRARLTELPAGAPTRGALPVVVDDAKGRADALALALAHGEVRLKREQRLGVVQVPGESERAFMDRVIVAAREAGDAEKDALTAKFQKKIDALAKKRDAVSAAKQKASAKASEAQFDLVADIGTSVLGALFGRRTSVTTHAKRAARAVKQGSRASAASGRASAHDAQLLALHDEIAALEAELAAEIAARSHGVQLDEVVLAPQKSTSRVDDVRWVWAPYVDDAPGW